ncbi:LysM peptidoglycan-binding domain-containing protein [Pseudonocardia sp. H11422]|uniref:LysM peptidoglycan-binding domain-containing protein n=1 Tax=Pseudonocardia sp. H11422 TaxID=2835866 RepID=UPI001BDCE3B3|nr:LysM peptidoglycan-binding domain-containing protein [Pseudonocardia sp. H11422]
MPRLPHGQIVTTEGLQEAWESLAARGAEEVLGFAAAAPVDLNDFDFLFPTLQGDPANLLPESTDTVAALKALSATMVDQNQIGGGNDAPIPAAYTYFAQFVDHDITLEVQPADLPPSASGAMDVLLADDMAPIPLEEIRNAVRNFRTATLDLDSLYGLPAPRDPNNGAKMRIGKVTELNDPNEPFVRPPGKGIDNDLPREPRSDNVLHDRAALIGDPRNDENTIISQLHVAFLKAHNRLVDDGRSFEEARRILGQHYQHIVIHDFLKRVADPAIVDDITEQGNRWYNATAEPFFMPLEFAVAGFRFGHTMVRAAYDFNTNFNFPDGREATLELLFTFSALSGQLGFGDGTDTLPENWIIEWENIIGDDPAVNKARRFDTRLAAIGDKALFNLQTLDGQREPELAARLAARNLLRGYRLRMPTGQAVADFLGLPVLTAQQIRAAAGPDQEQALQDGGFLDRTPLWFYLLAEAEHHGGDRLGPVGSTIVAEVLIGLVRRSADSILRTPGWTASLPALKPGTFELADLLRFARVLPGGAPTHSYVVQAGDTLSKIAQEQLGDATRWPEIFALNRNIIRHPDRIFPGQTLILPTGPAVQPQLRFYVVQPGDTLSEIARQHLGAADRWPEIFALNGDVLTNPDVIVVGQVLQLPPK